jgi:type I restriction enzyme M protein
MASKDVLLNVLEKFTSPYINLTPFEKNDPDGRKLPPLTNLGMGYVFEELIENSMKIITKKPENTLHRAK